MAGVMIQKLKKRIKDEYEVAEYYYKLLSSLNDLKLTEREVQLVAFMAIHKAIAYSEMKSRFCERYNGTSEQTISNMISRLKKKRVIIKEKGKLKVNPEIALSFAEGIILQITLINGI